MRAGTSAEGWGEYAKNTSFIRVFGILGLLLVSSELVSKGINATEVIASVAKNIGGSGGGKDTFAQAGGDSPQGIKEAIEEAKKILEKKG